MRDAVRNTRFHARISLEREFLTPVNAAFGAKATLAGMTEKAITSWRERAAGQFDPRTIFDVAEILMEASRRAEFLADDSRDVFEPSRKEVSGADILRKLLSDRIASISEITG